MLGRTGWQTHSLSDGAALRKVDPALAPISTALGVLGMPGMTAYAGLLEVGKPKAGETLVVAAASGAVGSVVGQIAKIKGLRAVGIAGGPDKCRYVKDELGFDECLDHRAPDLAGAARHRLSERHRHLFRECRGAGTGGGAAAAQYVRAHSDLRHHRPLQRHRAAARTDHLPAVWRMILTKRLTVRGLLVTDFAALHDDFLRDVSAWMREGRDQISRGYRRRLRKRAARADRAFARREFRQTSGARRGTESLE